MEQVEPFTLRQAAGLRAVPTPLAESVIVVIDAQREYLDGKLALPDVEPATANIARLIAGARTVGAPVVHVVHQGRAGGLFDPEVGGRIIDAVQPAAGEHVVSKTLPNSFAGTTLAAVLHELGDKPLVLAGFMTHMCVSATARAATDLGIETTIAADATGTRSLPSTAGGAPVPADQIHEAELAALADRFSVVATTDA